MVCPQSRPSNRVILGLDPRIQVSAAMDPRLKAEDDTSKLIHNSPAGSFPDETSKLFRQSNLNSTEAIHS